MPPPETKHQELFETSRGKAGNSSWLLRFWMVIMLIAMGGLAAVHIHAKQVNIEEEVDTYFSVPVKTTVGNNQLLVGTISLLIDPEQEKGLERRKNQLSTVISASLVELYQGATRPRLTDVRNALLASINAYLPRKLHIREVLIQDLIVGTA